MDDLKLETIERIYKEFKEKSEETVRNIKNSNCDKVYAKGKLCSVYPFEIEKMSGRVPNGKAVDKPELKDGYYTYYYNDAGQVRMIEYASSFLGRNYQYEIYEHTEELLIKYRYEISGACSVIMMYMSDNNISQTYKLYRGERLEICRNSYSGGKLNLINACLYDFITRTKMREWTEEFVYDKKDNFIGIQRFENGYRENIYWKNRIKIKKLEREITGCINAINSRKSDVNEYCCINAALESKEPYVGVSGEGCHDSGHDSEIIKIKEYYLDEDEKEKVCNLILRIITDGWNSGSMDINHKYKISNNGKSILKNKEKLPGWFKNNPQIKYDDFHVSCKGGQVQHHVKSINQIKREIKDSIKNLHTLGEIYSSFFEIFNCYIKYKGEWLENDFLFCAEAVQHNGELMFEMEISCQLAAGDNLYKTGIKVFYKFEEWNKTASMTVWKSDIENDFFDYILDTDIYKTAVGKKIYGKCSFFENLE